MSLFRLEKYAKGDGDPIDTSDALSILSEIESIKKEYYNKGIDTAISLVNDCMDYEDRMLGKDKTIICGLESSKKSVPTSEPEDDDTDMEDEIEELGLEECEQCGETAWDGYICHSCGAKNI